MEEREKNGMVTVRKENPWAWTALALILVLYVLSALRVGPVSAFGNIGDDALYFSSAKALANGRGYILPSFPVPLRATKYPEMYPLLLAGVWKVDPHFPGNVNVAVGLTLVFGCAVLLFAFLLLRGWRELGDWLAILAVGLCALSLSFLELSASVMTDVPFMALVLGALWLSEGRDRNRWAVFAAGLLAGLSVGFRSLGVAAIAGVVILLLVRRDFRRLVWFSVAALPLTLFSLWPALSALAHPVGARLTVGLGGNGWTQTLCYYSSYACSWRLGMTTQGALSAVLWTNLKDVLQDPGLTLLSPLIRGRAPWSVAAVMLLSVAAYVGVIRRIRAAGWNGYVLTFLFVLPVILAWPYTPGRFLLTFLPLFFGGLCLEGRHLSNLVAQRLRDSRSTPERMTAGILAAVGLVLLTTVAINFGYAIPSQVVGVAAIQRKSLADKRRAYDWIRKNTARHARIISYDSGLAYLYTGRPALPATTCLPQAFYLHDPAYAEHDAAHLTDVPRRIGASYWLATKADFALTGSLDYTALQQMQKRVLAAAPVVYRSADGSVRLYDTRCLWEAEKQGCLATSRDEAPGTAQPNPTASRETKHK